MFAKLFKCKHSASQKPRLPEELENFLNQVDLEYMRSFDTKSTKKLVQYLRRDCYLKVSTRVYSAPDRYFGNEKFRDTNWQVTDVQGDQASITKTVTFDKIRVGLSKLSVAEDYTETWLVDTKALLVLDILGQN